jgi:hypothetical protein
MPEPQDKAELPTQEMLAPEEQEALREDAKRLDEFGYKGVCAPSDKAARRLNDANFNLAPESR